MLPHFVRMMEYRAREEIEKFGAAIGAEEQREGAADCVQRLAARAEAGRLEYYGVDHDALERVAAEAATRPELRLNTPDPPGEGELLAVLERAL
jgi:alcohol dehydrogenase class IV